MLRIESKAREAMEVAKNMVKVIDEERAALLAREHDLLHREATIASEDSRLSTLRTDLEAQARDLEARCLCQ